MTKHKRCLYLLSSEFDQVLSFTSEMPFKGIARLETREVDTGVIRIGMTSRIIADAF